ncbi:hypothetical protein BAE44_0012639 [Dichanthelium oligosanthes]|uniref:Uncharacterized protein n=1 Tax=Dichanthelium oligosanthes TaxID=888268 RepID=A0A1E5VMP0_9POAL|nr:hypothetical protein BAE44_0012639 [Dichanthelium oligosanthes]
MAGNTAMNKPEIAAEVAVAAKLAPCTTTMKMTDSNKGWHSKWFYVANPPLPLPAFSGHFAKKVDEWDWGVDMDERRMWVGPMLELLGLLKNAGLTGVKVLWTFFERRVQPLMVWAHPMFRYTGAGDLMRMSPEVLEQAEVRSRIWAVIRQVQADVDVVELDHHKAGLAPDPATRREGYNPFNPLHARPHYPPLANDEDKRDANQVENKS